MSEEHPILRPTVRDEVQEELTFHVEMRVRQLKEQGMSEREARAEALRRFGDLAGVGAECRRLGEVRERDRRRVELWAELRQDVRFGLRQLRRAPAFATVAVLTLALGIAATTAVFSVVQSVLLQPLPFADSDRIVVPQAHKKGQGAWGTTYADFEDWRRAGVFGAVAVYQAFGVNVGGPGSEPERLQIAVTTDQFLEALGVTPILGRDFRPEERVVGSPRRCLISYDLWQRRFGGRRDVVGQQLVVGGRPMEVLGVLPRDRVFPANVALWSPLKLDDEERQSYQRRDNFVFESIARLAPGKTLERTNAELAGLAARVAAQEPTIRGDIGIEAAPLVSVLVGSSLPRALWLLLGAVALVLAIGCVNVANLLLARAAVRGRELAVRATLGAGRARLLRQLLTESLVLGLVGGALGAFLAWAATRALPRLAPADLPRLEHVGVQVPVLLFALGVSLVATLLFGVGPALRIAHGEAAPTLSGGSTRGTTAAAGRRRGLLVASELALALVLFVGASLVLRSLHELVNTATGFRTAKLLTFQMSLQGPRYEEDAVRAATFETIRERLGAVPGVERAALLGSLPLGGGGFYLGRVFLPEGRPEPPAGEEVGAQWTPVTPGSFATLGIPFLVGRDFASSDAGAAPPVMIVNREFARKMFGRLDVLGERVRSWRDENVYREIVGVVGDVRYFGAGDETRALVYVPAAQCTWGSWTVAVRTRGEPGSVVSALRGALAEIDPLVPMSELRTMDEVLAASVAPRRFAAVLLAGFAGLALLLALIGVYGVLSYEVAQRTREIGIRMALGSRRSDVLRLVVGEASSLVALGVLAGVAAALLLSRLLAPLLYETPARDPVTYAASAGLLALVALLAAWIPARRAAGGDPMVAMGGE
jgi:putative ABC transport system permease protein